MQVPRKFTEVNASAAQFGIVYKHFWNESIFGFVFLAALVCFCNTMADPAKATPGVFTQSEKLSVHQGTPFGIVSKHFWNQPQTNYKNEQNTKRANTKKIAPNDFQRSIAWFPKELNAVIDLQRSIAWFSKESLNYHQVVIGTWVKAAL